MTAADQLERIAKAHPPSAIAIYELDKGYSQWVWLCPRHLKQRERLGYEVKRRKEPPHQLTCDDRNRGPCS